MSLIDSVRDILIKAGLPADPLPPIGALLAGVPGYPPAFERNGRRGAGRSPRVTACHLHGDPGV
jgi:hypothetical protein